MTSPTQKLIDEVATLKQQVEILLERMPKCDECLSNDRLGRLYFLYHKDLSTEGSSRECLFYQGSRYQHNQYRRWCDHCLQNYGVKALESNITDEIGESFFYRQGFVDHVGMTIYLERF